MTMAPPPQRRRAVPPGGISVQTGAGINLILGLWLIVAPWVLRFGSAATLGWDTAIAGALVTLFAGARLYGIAHTSWLSWANVLIGLWLIISPWIFGAVTTQAYWNDVVAGIVVALVAAWSALHVPSPLAPAR